ncbi:MAG: 3-dehydroquinate synthase, partial [Polaromonas sp.]|nr:3-dehydroquinate synthase [Gemmatimonadaceae bacterium]
MSEHASHTITIDLGDRSYPIRIGAGLLDNPGTWAEVPTSDRALIVTNTTVLPLYAAQLERSIAWRHRAIRVLALPDGEAHKTFETLNLIFDELLEIASDRKTVLYALGGGVVGWMTGFAGACYKSGAPLAGG